MADSEWASESESDNDLNESRGGGGAPGGIADQALVAPPRQTCGESDAARRDSRIKALVVTRINALVVTRIKALMATLIRALVMTRIGALVKTRINLNALVVTRINRLVAESLAGAGGVAPCLRR